MSLVEALLPEFDREMGLTRRVLERVPDDQFAWRPTDKSMFLGQLAEHIAEMPRWAFDALTKDRVDAATRRAADYTSPATRAAMLALFDHNLKDGRAALVGRTDGELLAPFTLLAQGKEIFTIPKVAALRSFVLNHLIHHRGQLTVYLRLQNVPIPSLYGPSGDESA